MNKVKFFSVGAVTAFVAIGIYSFRPLPDERFFHRKTKAVPSVMPAQMYESSLPYPYDHNVPGSAAGSKALK